MSLEVLHVDKPARQASPITVLFDAASNHTDTEVVNRALAVVGETRGRLTGTTVTRYASDPRALATLYRD